MLAWYFNANEKKQIKWNKNKKGFKTLIKEMATLCLQQEEMITEKVPSKERDCSECFRENCGKSRLVAQNRNFIRVISNWKYSEK